MLPTLPPLSGDTSDEAEFLRRRMERHYYLSAIRLLHYALGNKNPEALEEARA